MNIAPVTLEGSVHHERRKGDRRKTRVINETKPRVLPFKKASSANIGQLIDVWA